MAIEHSTDTAVSAAGAEPIDLAERSVSFELEGASFLVADLPMLIQLKEEVGQPRDLAIIPVSRATLAVFGERDSD